MKKRTFVWVSILVCILAEMGLFGCKSDNDNLDISGLWWRNYEVIKIDVKNNTGTATNYYDETSTPEKVEVADLCKIAWTENGVNFYWYIEPSEDGIIVHTGPSPFEDDEDIQIKYTGKKVSDIRKLNGTWVNNSHVNSYVMKTSLTFNYKNSSIIQKIDGEQVLKAKYTYTPIKRVTFYSSRSFRDFKDETIVHNIDSSTKRFLIGNGNVLCNLYDADDSLSTAIRLSALPKVKNGNIIGNWKKMSMWGVEDESLCFSQNKDKIMLANYGYANINQTDTFMFIDSCTNECRYMQLTNDGFLLGSAEGIAFEEFGNDLSGHYVGKKISDINKINGVYKYNHGDDSYELSFSKEKVRITDSDMDEQADYTLAPCTFIRIVDDEGYERIWTAIFIGDDTILVDKFGGAFEVYTRSQMSQIIE